MTRGAAAHPVNGLHCAGSTHIHGFHLHQWRRPCRSQIRGESLASIEHPSGEYAFAHQFRAESHLVRQVHAENIDRCPANRRSPDKNGSVPSEMALPFVASGIKKPRSSARLPVNAGKVADAATIAGEAGPCEIAEHRLAAMLLGNDVVRFKASRRVCLGKPAVFATSAGAPSDAIAQSGRNAAHAPAACFFKACLALEWRMPSKAPSSSYASISSSSRGVSLPE